MEFKLFDRIRDDDDDQTNQSSNSGDFGDFGGPNNDTGNPSGSFGGNGVERRVSDMFDQGYSEEEIKQELQGQFSQTEIERAINSAVKNSATGNDNSGSMGQDGPEPMTPYKSQDEAVSPMDEGFDDGSQEDNQMNQNTNQQQQGMQQNQGFNQNNDTNPQPQQPQGQGPQPANPSQGTVDPQVEELIETIVSENFQRVEQRFDEIFDEIDVLADKVGELEDRVEELEIRDDEDQQEFVQKVDEVEDHIDSYESRIGGLEKAFQQVLPSLVDNVRDLTSLVQEIKQEKGIETDTNVSNQDMDDMDIDNW